MQCIEAFAKAYSLTSITIERAGIGFKHINRVPFIACIYCNAVCTNNFSQFSLEYIIFSFIGRHSFCYCNFVIIGQFNIINCQESIAISLCIFMELIQTIYRHICIFVLTIRKVFHRLFCCCQFFGNTSHTDQICT